jgi:predicted transport protein
MSKLDDAVSNMIANLESKTGKSLADWVKLVQAEKLEKHGERVTFLKSKHGLGHGYANLVAHSVAGGGTPSRGEDPVAAQYEGAKAPLRPAYDSILAAVQKFGPDVEVAPKKAYVSLRRKKQFAIVQPSTATRLDVGLNLKGVPPKGRLEVSGSFNSMVSHRVRLESGKGVDKELIGWLKQAYDQA